MVFPGTLAQPGHGGAQRDTGGLTPGHTGGAGAHRGTPVVQGHTGAHREGATEGAVSYGGRCHTREHGVQCGGTPGGHTRVLKAHLGTPDTPGTPGTQGHNGARRGGQHRGGGSRIRHTGHPGESHWS